MFSQPRGAEIEKFLHYCITCHELFPKTPHKGVSRKKIKFFFLKDVQKNKQKKQKNVFYSES